MVNGRDREDAIGVREKFFERITSGAIDRLGKESKHGLQQVVEAFPDKYHRYLAEYYFAISDSYKERRVIDDHLTSPPKIAAITAIAFASAPVLRISKVTLNGATIDDVEGYQINLSARMGVAAARQIVGCGPFVRFGFDPGIWKVLKGHPSYISISEPRYENVFESVFASLTRRLSLLSLPLASKKYDIDSAWNPFDGCWLSFVRGARKRWRLTEEQLLYIDANVDIWEAIYRTCVVYKHDEWARYRVRHGVTNISDGPASRST